MSELIERIESIIKAKGTNFKRVERECGLGNGTIKRWDIQSPRLDKLILVSEYLQVSLDYLVFGRSCSETQSDGDCPLEADEADLLTMYRLLPDHKKEDAFDIICTLYQKHVERKKESIYWTYKEDKLKRKNAAADDDSQGGIA